MYDDGGFFEELNEDDVEEVELSAVEEDFDNVEEFKESAVYQEINGVLQEVEEENNSNGSDTVYDSETFSSDISENGDVKVIYVSKYALQDNPQSVSGNQIILLDSSQFEVLIDEISSLKQDTVQTETVSQNDYSAYLQDLQDMTQGCLLVNVMMFALCFGYFVKETIFRGL